MLKKLKGRDGFGIMEVLVAALVLGFLYMAVMHMQTGNHEALLRIRGRDGAVEVAQQVLDSLKTVGVAAIPSSDTKDTVIDNLGTVNKSWDRQMGGQSSITYIPVITVSKTNEFKATTDSEYEPVSHVYAKQVNVSVSWQFKGSRQSINVSGVIR